MPQWILMVFIFSFPRHRTGIYLVALLHSVDFFSPLACASLNAWQKPEPSNGLYGHGTVTEKWRRKTEKTREKMDGKDCVARCRTWSLWWCAFSHVYIHFNFTLQHLEIVWFLLGVCFLLAHNAKYAPQTILLEVYKKSAFSLHPRTKQKKSYCENSYKNIPCSYEFPANQISARQRLPHDKQNSATILNVSTHAYICTLHLQTFAY